MGPDELKFVGTVLYRAVQVATTFDAKHMVYIDIHIYVYVYTYREYIYI